MNFILRNYLKYYFDVLSFIFILDLDLELLECFHQSGIIFLTGDNLQGSSTQFDFFLQKIKFVLENIYHKEMEGIFLIF